MAHKTISKMAQKPASAKTMIYSACLATMAATAVSASAAEFKLDNGVQAKVNATVTYGTTYRTEDPDRFARPRVVRPRAWRTCGQIRAAMQAPVI